MFDLFNIMFTTSTVIAPFVQNFKCTKRSGAGVAAIVVAFAVAIAIAIHVIPSLSQSSQTPSIASLK